ncbi:hypothetical protein CLOSPI_01270 [Thomasclavelia spiroformis DSM 1552]|uniref:Asp23/Gls24 family envelope stress response protein n=2 Tax=Thomasclavelia spiroformis TaxID=29348 RepID=B1C213_9FIRM|nr:hypothetical protein CLOSPI_01270 [Thomasclavelia spiroformis DSM 1552]
MNFILILYTISVYKGAVNMSQEYYSVEKETNLGTLNIGLNVFQSIIIETVKAMNGICFEGNMINMPGNSPINVRLNKNNQVIVDVAILIDYGLNVTTTTTALQNKIIQSCFEMTGIKNIKVNIEIKGINF